MYRRRYFHELYIHTLACICTCNIGFIHRDQNILSLSWTFYVLSIFMRHVLPSDLYVLSANLDTYSFGIVARFHPVNLSFRYAPSRSLHEMLIVKKLHNIRKKKWEHKNYLEEKIEHGSMTGIRKSILIFMIVLSTVLRYHESIGESY